MSLSRSQARDEVMAVVVDAAVAAGVPVARVIFDGKDNAKPVSSPALAWVRAVLRHQESRKRSLTGGLGKSRFVHDANLIVQLFVPSGDGLLASDAAADHFTSRMMGKVTPGGVRFFGVSANEIGEDGPWYNTNVFARIEYDEFVLT